MLRGVRSETTSSKSSRILFKSTVQNVQYIVILREFKNQVLGIDKAMTFCINWQNGSYWKGLFSVNGKGDMFPSTLQGCNFSALTF